MAARCAASLIVVRSAPSSTSGIRRSTCTSHALSFPLDQETRHLVIWLSGYLVIWLPNSRFPRLGMQRARESLGGNHDARPRNDEFVADEQVHAIVLHGWNGPERIPHAPFGIHPLRFQRIAVAKLENH